MQPPYQPSYNPPTPDDDRAYADPAKPTTLPPQTLATIGDLLDAKGVGVGLVRGAWNAALRRHARGTQGIYGGASQLPGASPAVQLLRRARPEDARRRPRGAPDATSTHASSPTPPPAQLPAGGVLQAAGQAEPARRLRQHQRGRRAHRRRRSPAAGEPAVAAHAGRGDLRRERRLLGPRRAAPKGDRWGRARAFRRSSSRRSRRRASSTTRRTTPARSCASSRTAGRSSPLPGLRRTRHRARGNGLPPMGDLSAALATR